MFEYSAKKKGLSHHTPPYNHSFVLNYYNKIKKNCKRSIKISSFLSFLMATKKGTATPKYKTGDRVIKKNSNQFGGEAELSLIGRGAWKGVIIEDHLNGFTPHKNIPDSRGKTSFHYKVLRDGFKSTEVYVQHMLVKEN